MRRRRIQILLMAALLLSGCSTYYKRNAAESAIAVQEENQVQQEDQQSGPGGGKFDPDSMTIESLELPDDRYQSNNPEIFIATDIHYLAKELTDFGDAFEEMVQKEDGKLVPYVWEILDTFLDVVVERKPQALILSGDLTLQGEYYSHEALAQKLARVERAGTDVVVIPGNHDINNTKAASYQNKTIMPTEWTSPDAFAAVYDAYGYAEAISRDPDSLSYIYELTDGTWLLMLDSCQYEDGNQIGGMIRTSTYTWMEEWLEAAWKDERNVIAVAHHNLMDESRIYEEDCTIEHAEELERVLDDWGVTLFLSGHLHTQHYRSAQDYDLDEIVTGCLSMSPCQYGVLKYFGPDKYDYHTERIDVGAWAERNGNPDVNLKDFEEYADEFLRDVFYEQARTSLAGRRIPETDIELMSDFYADLAAYSVAGNAVEVKAEAENAWEYRLWQEYGERNIRGMYLSEILEDADRDYNTFQKDK